MIQDCTHPRANHQHGTYLAYQKDGCRCEPCRAASSREAKRISYRTWTGTHTYVDAARARAHVLDLLDTLTVGQVEERSGVHRTAIRVLIGDWPGRPATKRVARKTEAALLAVTAERVGPEAQGLVDSTGTVRRLRALYAMGYDRRRLTRALGMSDRTTWLLMMHPDANPLVRVATRDNVRALYDRLSMTPPPVGPVALRTQRNAARRGWHPPLAWDDDTIDDPSVTPITVRDSRGLDLDEFVFLLRTGETPEAAAKRLGVTFDAVQQAMGRHKRDDVRAAIA